MPTLSPTSRWHRLLPAGLWTLVLILAVYFAYFCMGAAARSSHGFIALYTASQLAVEGAEVSLFYDDAWYMDQAMRFQPDILEVYAPHPPTATLLALPLVGLSYRGARIVWIIFSVLCLTAALGWMLRTLPFEGVSTPCFLLVVLLYQPLYENLALGQAYAVLLALFVAAWYSYRHQHEALLGIVLGVMLVVKVAGVLLWVLLLVQRRWRALAWATATALVLVLGTLPWLGFEAWQTYFHVVPDLTAQPKWSVTAYQTLNGFFRHLLVFDATWNPAPLVHAPVLGIWFPRFSFAAITGLCAYMAVKRQDQPDLIFAVFVIANLLLSPFSSDYHYTLMLLPLAILIVWVQKQPRRWIWIAFGLSVVLIANPLPHQSPRLAAGAVAFLAYPKLYGALLLGGLAFWAWRSRISAQPAPA